MTEDQFEKFMTMQAAQLAMLQSINRNVQALVMNNHRLAHHNWNDIFTDLQHAQAFVRNRMAEGPADR